MLGGNVIGLDGTGNSVIGSSEGILLETSNLAFTLDGNSNQVSMLSGISDTSATITGNSNLIITTAYNSVTFSANDYGDTLMRSMAWPRMIMHHIMGYEKLHRVILSLCLLSNMV